MARAVRISLANKCQLFFGGAVVLILTAALTVGWFRMKTLVLEGQQEAARSLVSAWMEGRLEARELPAPVPSSTQPAGKSQATPRGHILLFREIDSDQFRIPTAQDEFLSQAIEAFETYRDRNEAGELAYDEHGKPYYRYARAIRKSDEDRRQAGTAANFTAALDTTAMADPVRRVLLIHLKADLAQRQLTLNRIYVVAAGLFAGLLAIGIFWFITTRIILAPVRLLSSTAEKISAGDLNIRAEIHTGDEFEQLSRMLNTMLDNLRKGETELRQINKSVEIKLGELAETNVTLYESNRIKGEFLANVSHELRTPLNAIIGFAEVLEETLKDRTGPVDEKRKRYAANIITSSRRLLDLINELLDLAKIEAGRMDVRVAPQSVTDLFENLTTLMRPLAEKRQIEIKVKMDRGLPIVQTDGGKLFQILFNFLSNAIKFTPEGGTITLSATLIPAGYGVVAADGAYTPGPGDRLRISVSDTGPGIPPAMQEKIFEKFMQLDATVTKEHGGTGLGLAISRELAKLLQGQIQLDSDVDKGATFSLVIPLLLEDKSTPLMPNVGAGAAQTVPA